MTERRQQCNDHDHDHRQRRGERGGERGRPVHFYEHSNQSAPIPSTSAWGQGGRHQHYYPAPMMETSARSNHQSQRYENASLQRASGNAHSFSSSEDRGRRGKNGSSFSSVVMGGKRARQEPSEYQSDQRRERQHERRREEINQERHGEPMPRKSVCTASSSASRRQLQEQPIELDGDQRGNGREINCDQSREGNHEPSKVPSHDNEAEVTITTIVPTKPSNSPSKQGTSGDRVQLFSNYFRILKKATWTLFMYSVKFSPATESRSLKSGLLFQQIESLGSYLFDGTVLYMMVKLDSKGGVTKFVTKSNRDEPFEITIELVGLVSPNNNQYFHVWSLLLRKCENALGLQLVGRNYYDAKAAVPFARHRLQLWPGYITAIHQHERDVLLCANISTKVMRSDTAYEVFRQHRDSSEYEVTFTNAMLRRTVLTRYNNKTYKIGDVDFNKSPESTFDLRDGETISYIDYYKRHYNINIENRRQPLLIVKSSARKVRAGQAAFIALVPELCYMTGFDESMRKNTYLMRDVANVTRQSPNDQMKGLKDFIRRLKGNDQNEANFVKYRFEPDSNPLEVQGRCLKNETVLFGNKKTFEPHQKPEWSREFHNNEMYVSQHLQNWVLIYSKTEKTCARDFVGVLQRASIGMKYTVNDPFCIEVIPNLKRRGYESALESGYSHDPQLFMCVVPNQSEDLYSLIKKTCCGYAKPSQVIVSTTIRKHQNALMSVATKVAIQINCKLGGVPWMINIVLKGLMTIGFDVSHDNENNKYSYGALVCTMDLQLKQKYFSTVDKHACGEELSNSLALKMRILMLEFKREHNTLPEKILFYRDGVGAGQIDYVKAIELQNILSSLSIEYGDRTVPLTYIIVTKRGNRRFFIRNRGSYDNPRPGTVVDDVVTFPHRHDFELISQIARQGTVSPTNYNILHNATGLSSDKLQRLTYKQTHLYYNWAGTLSVPAVCQYAHKLAFMCEKYLDGHAPTNELQNRLYFL